MTGQTPEAVARLFDAYEEVKRAQGRMDMEDVLLLTAGLLAEDERVAAQVRRQYKWFVVDEFQDVSPLQSALLDLWLGGRDELCVVGDPAQTIYSFAGANADYLRDFPAKHPGTTSIELVRNYRSTPQVVEAANRLLDGTPSQGVALRAQQPAGAAVEFHERSDEVAEAEAVAAQIAALRRTGRAPAEMAVLFRINAQSENFEEALAGRGIPYVVRGAARFFDRPEVREAVTRIRGAARSGQGEAEGDGVVDTVRGHARRHGLDRRAAVRPRPDPGPLGVVAGADGPGLRVRQGRRHARRVRRRPRPARGRAARPGRRRRHAGDVPRRQGPGVGLGLPVRAPGRHAADHLRRDAGRGRGGAPAALRRHDPGPARALAVLVAGPPARRPRVPQAVPVPRPAAARHAAGVRHGRASKSKRGARMCRECGKPLSTGAEKKTGRCADCPASYDEALFERLREWRKGRADAEEVPAFVVFSDATLQLIAEVKPSSTKALLGISGIGPQKLERYGEDLFGRSFSEIVIKSFAHDIGQPLPCSRPKNRVTSELTTPDAQTHRRRWTHEQHLQPADGG